MEQGVSYELVCCLETNESMNETLIVGNNEHVFEYIYDFRCQRFMTAMTNP